MLLGIDWLRGARCKRRAQTWCGSGERVAGAQEVLTLFLAELQFSGCETVVVSSSSVAATGAYIPYSYQAV